MLALSTVYPVSSIENQATSIEKQLTSDEHPVSRIEHSSPAERDRNSSPPPDHQNKKPRYSRRLARPGVALWLGASSGFTLLRRDRLRLGWSLAEPGAQGGTRTPTPLGT